jgi:hypothetical protein
VKDDALLTKKPGTKWLERHKSLCRLPPSRPYILRQVKKVESKNKVLPISEQAKTCEIRIREITSYISIERGMKRNILRGEKALEWQENEIESSRVVNEDQSACYHLNNSFIVNQ